MNNFEKMSVLVTGAEGFIGSHLTRRLVHEGARVSALVNPRASLGRLAGLEDKIVCHPLDIRDAGALEEFVIESKPRRIFHLAAITDVGRGWERLSEAMAVNLGGTINLLRALRRIDYEIMISTCTAEVYGRNPAPFKEDMPLDPVSPYSFSKAAATTFCRMAAATLDASVDILRLFLVYGPGQGEERFLPQLIRAGLSGRSFRMTAGEQTREYTYIDDVIEGLLVTACSGPGRGKVYNLGTGDEISLNSLVGTVENIAGCRINRDPEALPYRSREIRRFVGDHSRIKKDLGWIPEVDLEEGLRRTIDWYRNLQDGK